MCSPSSSVLNDLSLQNRMRSSSLEILLCIALRQAPNEPKHLCVVIPQSRLRILVRRRQARDVAVPSLGCQARRALDVRVRSTRCARPSRRQTPRRGTGPQALLEDQLGQAARRLREIGCGGSTSIRRSVGGGAGAACREAVVVGVVVDAGGREARDVVEGGCGRGGKIGFSSRRFTQNGLDVLVAALVGLPARVAEGLVNGMDVELFEEGVVGGLRCRFRLRFLCGFFGHCRHNV